MALESPHLSLQEEHVPGTCECLAGHQLGWPAVAWGLGTVKRSVSQGPGAPPLLESPKESAGLHLVFRKSDRWTLEGCWLPSLDSFPSMSQKRVSGHLFSLQRLINAICAVNSQSLLWLFFFFFFHFNSLLQTLNIWGKIIPELQHHKLHWTQPTLVNSHWCLSKQLDCTWSLHT